MASSSKGLHRKEVRPDMVMDQVLEFRKGGELGCTLRFIHCSTSPCCIIVPLKGHGIAAEISKDH